MTTSPLKHPSSLLPRGLGSTGIQLPLLFFFCFFLISGFIGYKSVQTIGVFQEARNKALTNISLIAELHIEMLRAETGQRGYLLTELESYVTPYREAESVINDKLQALNDTNLDDAQHERLLTLQLLVNDKLSEMESTVEDITANREREAIQMLFTHRGRNLMDEISGLVQIMESYERSALYTNTVQTSKSRTTALLIVILTNLVGLIMVFLTYILIKNSMRKELAFGDHLKEANATLETKVEERTDELQRYSSELKRSNRELQDFAFVASHDLQEPLRKIRAFGDRLQSQYHESLGEQGNDYIRRMQNASERMSKLIDDLLSFSRITTQVKPFVPVDLNKVLKEVLEDLEISIHENEADIQVVELPEIDGDYSQLKQLLQNLIGNALKFSRPGVSPVITLKSELLDEWTTRILVADNGIGFDNSFADRIFMPFQRLHGKNEYAGTGIGLAICRRIVERHGGTLTVNSESGKGSTFIIEIPLYHSEIEQEITSE